jgi:hypothetical protein
MAELFTPDRLEERVGEADFVIVTTPETPETLGMFNARLFARMKRGSYLINIARGGCVVTDDLIAALQSGQLAGAGLDVVAPEPLPPDSPLWGPLHVPHHWGESLFGYYLTDDAYVLRKHAQMLSDAGVDFIVFDVTNQFTYKPYYMALLRVFSEVRAAGGKTPQVAFLCPFWEPAKVVRELYRDLYEPGLHRDLWFQWQGKPLILADPELIEEGEGYPGNYIIGFRFLACSQCFENILGAVVHDHHAQRAAPHHVDLARAQGTGGGGGIG